MQNARTLGGRGSAAATLVVAALLVSGCQSDSSKQDGAERIRSDPNERFTESEYGVKASPRVTDLKKVRKGGGRAQVGRPYKVRGKWYYPKEQPGYAKVGHASWYGASFHGRLTANGEIYDMFGLSGAHPTFPLPSYARVTNVENGASVVVRINDRGPYVADRMMDLSAKAADMLGYKTDGVGNVKLEYVGKAPLEGDDTPVLMTSYRPGNVAPSVNDGLPSGVMLAMNETPSRTRTSGSRSGTAGLPGVRGIGSAGNGEGTSIDAIINGAASGEAGRAVPMPAFRPDASALVVASYAPTSRPAKTGAAAALDTLGRSDGVGQRIQIGSLANATTLEAVRRVSSASAARLVAEADGTSVSYALALPTGADADAILRQLWKAGADDAFVLRD